MVNLNMKKLSNFLSDSKGISSTISKVSFSVSFQKAINVHWFSIMGHLSKTLFFRYCRYKTLFITTANPSWKIEIALFEKKILAKLHHFVPQSKYIRAIRVVISNERPEKKAVSHKKRHGDNLTLADKINLKNAKMKDCGYSLCLSCRRSWVLPNQICVFCRNG